MIVPSRRRIRRMPVIKIPTLQKLANSVCTEVFPVKENVVVPVVGDCALSVLGLDEMYLIFGYLSRRDRLMCRAVCKEWYTWCLMYFRKDIQTITYKRRMIPMKTPLWKSISRAMCDIFYLNANTKHIIIESLKIYNKVNFVDLNDDNFMPIKKDDNLTADFTTNIVSLTVTQDMEGFHRCYSYFALALENLEQFIYSEDIKSSWGVHHFAEIRRLTPRCKIILHKVSAFMIEIDPNSDIKVKRLHALIKTVNVVKQFHIACCCLNKLVEIYQEYLTIDNYNVSALMHIDVLNIRIDPFNNKAGEVYKALVYVNTVLVNNNIVKKIHLDMETLPRIFVQYNDIYKFIKSGNILKHVTSLAIRYKEYIDIYEYFPCLVDLQLSRNVMDSSNNDNNIIDVPPNIIRISLNFPMQSVTMQPKDKDQVFSYHFLKMMTFSGNALCVKNVSLFALYNMSDILLMMPNTKSFSFTNGTAANTPLRRISVKDIVKGLVAATKAQNTLNVTIMCFNAYDDTLSWTDIFYLEKHGYKVRYVLKQKQHYICVTQEYIIIGLDDATMKYEQFYNINNIHNLYCHESSFIAKRSNYYCSSIATYHKKSCCLAAFHSVVADGKRKLAVVTVEGKRNRRSLSNVL